MLRRYVLLLVGLVGVALDVTLGLADSGHGEGAGVVLLRLVVVLFVEFCFLRILCTTAVFYNAVALVGFFWGVGHLLMYWKIGKVSAKGFIVCLILVHKFGILLTPLHMSILRGQIKACY